MATTWQPFVYSVRATDIVGIVLLEARSMATSVINPESITRASNILVLHCAISSVEGPPVDGFPII